MRFWSPISSCLSFLNYFICTSRGWKILFKKWGEKECELCVCAWQRVITTACAWKTRRENLLLSLVLDIASWEYNYMCTWCPVLSPSWREAHSSVGWYGNNVLKCILNFETDRRCMYETKLETERGSLFEIRSVFYRISQTTIIMASDDLIVIIWKLCLPLVSWN